MANYQLLKADIDAKVYQNGHQEITGENLNAVLNAMVTTLGAGYQFAGVATLNPATNPGTPDAKVFYIANGKGTYTNFGGLEVTEDEVVVLYWDSSWHKVSTGIASQEKLTELESKNSQLGQEVDKLQYVTLTQFTDGYMTVENIGDTIRQFGTKLKHIKINISSVGLSVGDVITYYGRGNSSAGYYDILFTDKDGVVLRAYPAQTEQIYNFTIEQGDELIYINAANVVVQHDNPYVKYKRTFAIYTKGGSFEDAIASGASIIKGEYTLTNGIILKERHIYGDGCLVHTTNGGMITLLSNAGLHNIKFDGGWDINRTSYTTPRYRECGFDPTKSDADIQQFNQSKWSGIGNKFVITIGNDVQPNDCQNSYVDGCVFTNFDGCAIWVGSGSHQTNNQPIISNCLFSACITAITAVAEFLRLSNLVIDNCFYGFIQRNGNVNIDNSFFKRCDCAMYVANSGGGLHSQMSNCEFAHNMLYGLYVNVTEANKGLGYVISNCQFADASIEGDSVYSLMFNGCRMENWIRITTGGQNSIHNSIFSKAYAESYGYTFLSFPADTSLMGNRGILGCTDADVNNNVLQYAN